MKRILAVLLILTALLFAACSDDIPSGEGYLVVGMECAYQPFNWAQLDDGNGAVSIYGGSTGCAAGKRYANGYDVMVAKMIAEELGRELVVVEYKWDSLVPGVQTAVLDLIIAGMSPTEERKQSIDFSDPYFSSNLVVVVRKDGDYADAASLADLEGAEIQAQKDTFHDTVVEQIPNVTHLAPAPDFTAMIAALQLKSIDGYIAEEPGAIADCSKNPDFTYIPLVNGGTGFVIDDPADVTIAIGAQKGSALIGEVNRVLSGISEADRQNMMRQAISLVPQS